MDIAKAIKSINPNAEFTYFDEDYSTIQWLNGTTPISKADIEAQFSAVEFDIAMADLRANRNQLLAETDWSVLPDVPLTSSQKSTMMNYRSDLRNITNGLKTVEDVNAVQLPEIPVL